MRDMVRACHKHDYTDLVIVHEHRGEPDGLIVSHMPHGPTAYFGLSGAVLRHDIAQSEDIDLGPVSEQYPHLIMENFSTPLGRRVRDVLRFLFPVPKPDSRRVMTFANTDDFISFRHHVYRKVGGGDVELTEVGPRFEMRLYQLKLGTVDQPEADNEWVLRPYMNTSSKRKALGE
ncbi:MAG: snoRNA-binding rRNA-processing protein imp4 [Cercozoa sp. M6MM]